MTDRKYLPDAVVLALRDLRLTGQREQANAIESVLKRAQWDEDNKVKDQKDFAQRQKAWVANEQFFFARVTGVVLPNGNVELYMNDASSHSQIVSRELVEDFAKRMGCDDKVYVAKKVMWETRYKWRDNLGDGAYRINKPNPMRSK